MHPMTDRSRLVLLFSVMAGVAVTVAVISWLVLYEAAYDHERKRLTDLAYNQKVLIEDLAEITGVPKFAITHRTLENIIMSLGDDDYSSLADDDSLQFLIGWRDGENIVFLVQSEGIERGSKNLTSVPFESNMAEPLRRALAGETGTVQALDYAGKEILAAYIPLPGATVGVVAKIDMADIRAPFIKAGVITGTGAFAIIFLGTILFGRVSTPMVERLESSVRTLANAQRIAHVGDFTRNLETGDIRWSDEMFHIFGVGRKTFRPTFEAILETIHPDDRDSVNDGIARSIADEIPFSAYARIIRPDGEERFVSIVGECVSVESGGPDRFVGTVQDITEWVEAVAALRESEERFRAVTQSIDDAIVAMDDENKIIHWNRGAANLFGYGEAEILGQPLMKLMPKRYRDRHAAAVAHVKQTGESRLIGKSMEMAGLRKDGSEFSAEISLGTWISGGKTYFSGVVRDITRRKQAEATLRKSEALFRAVVDHSPTKIHIKDVDGRYLLINKEAGKLFGVSDEDGRGKSTHDLFPKEVADAFVAHDRAVMEGGKAVQEEEEFTLEDGVHTYLTVKFPIHDGDKVTGVGAIGTDITEQKQAEEAYRRSEERLRGAIESLQEGFALYDADDRLIINNDVHRRINHNAKTVMERGCTFEDILRASLAAGYIVDAVGREEEFIRERVARHRDPGDSIIRQYSDGRWYILAEARTPEGGIAVTLTDITDQKQAEEAYRRSEERLGGAIESLQEGFTLFDADDRLIAANEVYKTIDPDVTEILKRHGTFEELTRARVQRGVIVEAIGREEEFIQERLRQHGNMKSPIIRHHADGKSYMVREARTPDGGIAVTFIDITDLKKTEAQLLQSAKLATLGQMASGIAHELNQPLNIIRMAAESSLIRIEEDAWDTDAHEQKLKQIEDQAERMAEIINHMRVFVREDKGAEDATFPPAASIENALTLLAQQFAASGIDLEKKISGARGLVRGSPVQLEQVVMNLLANARHAVTARIETAAAAGNAFEGRIAVTLEENAENKTITIAVTDNGGGIPPDARAHIFDPFYTTKAEGDGTGLGLSISYKIVEGMGGWLDAVDVEGGTRFEIVLPRAAKQPAPKKRSRKRKKAKAKTKTVSQNNHRILVVDDEALAAEGLAEYLGRKGYDVVTAGDGSEALALFGDRAADVVITDLRMPGMDGYELVRRLREMAPELPILVTTGHTTIGDDEEVVAEGATCVIKKPISLREIMEHLNEVVGHEGRTGI